MWRVKNIIAYVILVGMVFAAYVYFCNYLLFTFFLFLLMFLPLSGLLMYNGAKEVTASFVQGTFQAGKNIEQTIQLQVENKSWIPILYVALQLEVNNLFYDSEQLEVQCCLLAKSKEKISIPMTFQKSGCIEVSVSKLIIRDWLHIFQKVIPVKCREEFMVMPVADQMSFMEEIYSDYGTEENNQTGIQETSDAVSFVRDYVGGDRMQQIHWKLSAKKNKILVKEYDHVAKENVKLLIELTKDKMGSLDACLDMVYSITKVFLTWQQPVSLLWWSSRQECMQERIVGNEEMLEDAIYAIFYEQTYERSSKACIMMEQAGYEEDYFYVQPYEGGKEYIGEKIAVYNNKAVITKVEFLK